MKIKAALSMYYQDSREGLTVTRKTAITIENSERTWDFFLRKYPITYLSELNDAVLRKFFAHGEMELKWARMTTLTYRKNMSAFIRWCMNHKYMYDNPIWSLPKPPREEIKPKFYSEDQIEFIMRAVDYESKTYFERLRNKALFSVLALAGVRRGELLSLTIADIDFQNCIIHVRANTSKTKTERAVPMTLNLQGILSKYLNERGKFTTADCRDLWISQLTGKKFTQHGLKHLVEKLSKAVKFNVRVHSFRHSCATFIYASTQDLAAVQKMLGHKDISTTMIYTNVLPETIRNAAEMNRLDQLCTS